MNAANCEFVMIGGLWLPAVAGIERSPVYVGDYERAVSGVLRTAHVGKAMEWRVLLQGVAGEDVEALEEVLRSPLPVGCNIMGTEVIASVTELSSSHAPKRHGPDADWGRMNFEILVREVVVEQIMPGFTYEYQAFFDTGSFVWDWNAAGQPETVDVLLVGGGGGGRDTPQNSYLFGGGGGGAGGVLIHLGVPVSGNVSGSVGAGGSGGENGQDTTFGSLPPAVGGGAGVASGGSGGGGQGGPSGGPPGSPTSGQGNAGGTGNSSQSQTGYYGGGGGGGGAGSPGMNGMLSSGNGRGGAGGAGVDLLSLGWNYRLVPGLTRYVGGGGGGGGGRAGPAGGSTAGGAGGIGGGATGGRGTQSFAESRHGHDAAPNTGGGGGGHGGGGGGGSGYGGGAGGSGLVIVRWLVNP